MESNPNEDYSKSSSEKETDHTDTAGRSYECVFCKRGFTTAQALGGHMNIHRKDRAKNRPQSSFSSISENNYAMFSYRPQTHNHDHQYLVRASEVHVNYQTYFPSSTNKNKNNHMNVFGDEIWRGDLGLRAGESHLVAAADHEKEKRQGVSEEDELDLELRLGHDPVLF